MKNGQTHNKRNSDNSLPIYCLCRLSNTTKRQNYFLTDFTMPHKTLQGALGCGKGLSVTLFPFNPSASPIQEVKLW